MSKNFAKLRSILVVTTGAGIFFTGINIAKGNEKFYTRYLMPLVHKLPPETTHNLALLACKYKLVANSEYSNDNLITSFFSKTIKNPIGIAAGFDKQGEAVEGLLKLGFGFVEIGSVTPLPQPGNPTPRIYRLHSDRAIINRCGFNSDGHQVVLQRLNHLKESKNFDGVFGINLGKNKTSDSAISDYVQGVKIFGPIADYLVINISSPNTPGLRDLQGKKELQKLLVAVLEARNQLKANNNVPVLLKLAPDLSRKDVKDITDVIKMKNCKVDGLIISNTTTDKSTLSDQELAKEAGGLSGPPLRSKSTQLIANFYHETDGKIPIIGVGGISSGEDAYEKIEAGASYVQFYTAFIYNGPPVIRKIKDDLADIIAKNGFSNVSQVIGTNYKKYINKE